MTGPANANSERLDGFRQGLRELGYAEGKTILIDWRSAEGNPKRGRLLAAGLLELKPTVIVTAGAAATRAAKAATTTVPLVMAQDPDPVGNGLVASMARPGGNITGRSKWLPRSVEQVIDAAVRHKVPTAYARPEYVEGGG